MVEVKYRDRLGNKLFQYCIGRIVAEELGFALKAGPISGFENVTDLAGVGYSAPRIQYSKHKIDFNSIISDISPRKIIFHGWFQRFEYYRNYVASVRNWLHLPNLRNYLSVGLDDVVIHVRLGDYYHRFKRVLSYDYYESALNRLRPYNRVFICTDESDNREYLGYFDKYNPIYVGYDELDTLRFMKLFNKIVLSMSTFSWWGAFLSDARAIVYPLLSKNKGGCWGKNTSIDLRVDSDRYIYLDNLDLI